MSRENVKVTVGRGREGGATLLLILAEMFIAARAKTTSWILSHRTLTLTIIVSEDAAHELEDATSEHTRDDVGGAELAARSVNLRYAYAERQATRWLAALEELNHSMNDASFRDRPLPDLLRGRKELRRRIVDTAKRLIERHSITSAENAQSLHAYRAELIFIGKLLADSITEYATTFFAGVL